MVTIKEVKTKKEQREFVRFPLDLYKGNEYYVPMLYAGEFANFSPDYPFNKICDTICLLAYKDGKVAGRVQGIIQHDANKKWGYKQARFTRFDSIDDEEVSSALFEYLEKWASQHGMNEIVGPLGFSDFEREGLLIEGFNEPQTYEEQYNYEYYRRLIEAYGFEKDTDWLEYQIYGSDADTEKMLAMGNKLLERYNLTFWQAKTMSELLDHHIYDILGVVEQAYSPLYGTVPLNEETLRNYIKDFKSIVRPQDIGALIDKNGRTVAIAIVFPSISDAARASGGRITPRFLYRFLRDKKHPKHMDLGLIGVLPEYNSKGIITIMIGTLIERIRSDKLEYMETNLILEDNLKMQNLLKHFNKRRTKRRRCFKKQI
ncbi:MAG: hypothetical protein IKX80_10440 [Lachnospiraceae bacterium]|nr:hypothetical protein [Lachnospiraceae bacterium]MBR5733850.1 hypothetical protein [Lachnospiraceae bacterium]